jgi:hypothetical protein
MPVGAEPIGLVSDHEVGIVFVADELGPIGLWIGTADIPFFDRPGPGERVVDDGDVVVEQVGVVLVDLDALLEH